MNIQARWTIGGDFRLVDTDDEDAPLAVVTLYEPLKSQAIDDAEIIGRMILEGMLHVPHPYADTDKEQQ